MTVISIICAALCIFAVVVVWWSMKKIQKVLTEFKDEL